MCDGALLDVFHDLFFVILALLVFPRAEYLVDDLWRRIRLEEPRIVISLSEHVAEGFEGGEELRLLRVLSLHCAHHVGELVGERIPAQD